jgi:hypothetical protein
MPISAPVRRASLLASKQAQEEQSKLSAAKQKEETTKKPSPPPDAHHWSPAKDESSLLDDCERPACDNMLAMMKNVQKAIHRPAAPPAQEKDVVAVECPPTSAELGRSTWNLLHTMVRRKTPGTVFNSFSFEHLHIF